MDSAPARKKIEVRLFHSQEEADAADAEFWRRIPERDRMMLTWEMTREYFAIYRNGTDAPRLQRDAVRLIRG